MPSTRYHLSGPFSLLALIALVWVSAVPTEQNRIDQARDAYNTFIQTHPYNAPDRVYPDGPPGLDGPGERVEFEFLRTVDPATRTLPSERLLAANAAGRALSNVQMTPLTTSAWTERGPSNIGGRTRAIMWDPNPMTPNKVWAGGVSGGLWSTTDITNAATGWTKQNDFWDNLAVTAMAHDPTNTSTYYVATGEGFFNFDAVQGGGIFKSTNGGTSFSLLASTNPATDASFSFVNDLVVTGTGTLLAATREGNGVQRSTNGGTSWTPVLDGGTGATTSRAADLEIDANGDIYAAMGVFSNGGVYKSTDDGATWTQQTLPFPASGNADAANNYQRIEICTAPSDVNTVYATTQSTSSLNVNHVFKTTNAGMTWTSVTTPTPTNGQAWYDLICTVDPSDANRVYIGVATRVYRTDDGGTNWNLIGNSSDIHPDHHNIVYRPGSTTEAVFAHDGGIDYVANANTTGTNKPTYVIRDLDYNVTQYYGGDISPTAASNVLIGGTQDNATHYFDTAGIDAVTSPSPLSCCDGGFAIIDQDDANFAVGSIQNLALARSFDGGASYSGFFSNQYSNQFIGALAFDDREDILYTAGTANGNIARWSAMKDAMIAPTAAVVTIAEMGTGRGSTFAPSPFSTAGTSTVFIGTTGGRVVKVENAHSATPTGTNITGTINAGNISSIEIGASEMQLLVTVSNFGVNSVYETTDGGTTWNNKDSASLPDVPIRWALYNPNNRDQVLLATESGLWETSNISVATPTWTRVPGFPTVRVDQLQYRISDGTIAAFTHGRGVWTATWGTGVLPVELAAFDAAQDGDAISLRWQTRTETNNAGFGIEHRLPGQETFAEIGYVNGAGTSRTLQDYGFRAAIEEPGRHTFRIRQIDFDGTTSYSAEVEIDYTLAVRFALSEAYPNPFQQQSTFTLSLAESQAVTAEMYDLQGRRIRTLHDGYLEADQLHRFTVNGSYLAAGTYFIHVRGATFFETRQVVLVK